MKMSLVKTLFTKALLTSAAASVLILFSFTSLPGTTTQEGTSSSAIQVKYLGGDNEALFFNVKYDNRAGSKFKLIALDESGEPLFQDNYSIKDFEKKIKIPRLTETDYVIFLLKSPKENVELSYKVKVTTKVVDAPMVARN